LGGLWGLVTVIAGGVAKELRRKGKSILGKRTIPEGGRKGRPLGYRGAGGRGKRAIKSREKKWDEIEFKRVLVTTKNRLVFLTV